MLVTTRRFVVGVVNQTTYAVRAITSVTAEGEHIAGAPSGNGPLQWGSLLIVIGVALAFDDRLPIGALLTLLGAGLVLVGWTEHKAWPEAIQFVIRLRASSGEQSVYRSRDEQLVRRIVSALTEAIAS